MTNITLKVRENAAATDLIFKINNSTDAYATLNKLKDFSLKIEKVNTLVDQLDGANFKLTSPSYEETKLKGPVFNFENLRQGSYTLTETVNPSG